LLDSLLFKINNQLETKALKVNDGKHIAADATLIPSARKPKKCLDAKPISQDEFEVK